MLLVYVLIGIVTLGMGLMVRKLNRSVTRLNQEHLTLRRDHMKLRDEHMELQQYCNVLEKRIVNLERSRRLLSHIVKNANIHKPTGTELGIRLIQ